LHHCSRQADPSFVAMTIAVGRKSANGTHIRLTTTQKTVISSTFPSIPLVKLYFKDKYNIDLAREFVINTQVKTCYFDERLLAAKIS
jgi:hypothetical protein